MMRRRRRSRVTMLIADVGTVVDLAFCCCFLVVVVFMPPRWWREIQ
jgi:hypothetical protein